jgi:hypothetical protein
MKNKLKVLVACEESGVVRDAFIRAGHDATSCDIKATSSLGPHYTGDVTCKLRGEARQTARSKTFLGVAEAMAEQWGNYVCTRIK